MALDGHNDGELGGSPQPFPENPMDGQWELVRRYFVQYANGLCSHPTVQDIVSVDNVAECVRANRQLVQIICRELVKSAGMDLSLRGHFLGCLFRDALYFREVLSMGYFGSGDPSNEQLQVLLSDLGWGCDSDEVERVFCDFLAVQVGTRRQESFPVSDVQLVATADGQLDQIPVHVASARSLIWSIIERFRGFLGRASMPGGVEAK